MFPFVVAFTKTSSFNTRAEIEVVERDKDSRRYLDSIDLRNDEGGPTWVGHPTSPPERSFIGAGRGGPRRAAGCLLCGWNQG